MKVLVFGSLNYDYVYTVDHIISPGETEYSPAMEKTLGGKGLNQAVSIARAGAEVFLAGQVGDDGDMFFEACEKDTVDTTFIRQVEGKSGHTIIQLDINAQNSIIVFGGTNRMQSREHINKVLSNFDEGDILVIQNEINELDYIIDVAYKRGLRIVLNPSPFDENLSKCDLDKISMFIINEIEGMQLTGFHDPDEVLSAMEKTYPCAETILTLGEEGSVYKGEGKTIRQPAFSCNAIDTTGAGDTFTGYLVASLANGRSIEDAMRIASKAASVSCTKKGATCGIPYLREVA